MDIKSFFDTIDHERLMRLIGERIADGKLLALIRSFLKQGVLDGAENREPEEGTPQSVPLHC